MSRVRNGTGKVEKTLAQNYGSAPPSAAVIGEIELQKWKELLDHKTENQQLDDRTLRGTKHTMSQDRKKGWGNTVEGCHAAKEVTRRRRAEEEESRRRVIDNEEAELRVVERRSVVDEANRQLHQRDPRVVALNSQLLLHEVLQEREEQVSLSARKKQVQRERDAAYAETINRAAEQERLEKQEKALIARQNLVQLSQDRLAQLMEQKDLRSKEVQSARLEGNELRKLGEDAAHEEAQAKLTARSKARDVATEHKKQLKEKAERTPRKLDGLVENDPVLEERNLNHAVKKAVQNQLYQECLSARKERKDEARQLALQQFQSPTHKKDENVEKIISARSMESRVLEEDALRSNMKEKSRQQAAMLDSQLQEDSARRQRLGHYVPSPPKAGGGGGGKPLLNQMSRGSLRIMDAEASLKDPRIQVKMATQIAALEEEDRQTKIKQKQDAMALQRFHALQANQKRVNDKHHDHELKYEGQQMRSLEEEENKMFSNYIESQMPGEMNYKLKKNAQAPPKPLRAS